MKPEAHVRKREEPKAPSEEQEQRALATILDLAGVAWFHVPNGGPRNRATAGKLRAQGVKPGVPDIHIPEPAPGAPKGCVLELKRRDGLKSHISPEQNGWLNWYEEHGIPALVGWGWEDAAAKLMELGYPLGVRDVSRRYVEG